MYLKRYTDQYLFIVKCNQTYLFDSQSTVKYLENDKSLRSKI